MSAGKKDLGSFFVFFKKHFNFQKSLVAGFLQNASEIRGLVAVDYNHHPNTQVHETGDRRHTSQTSRAAASRVACRHA